MEISLLGMTFGETMIVISLILIAVFVFLVFLFLRKAKKIKVGKAKQKTDGGEKVLESFRENWEGVLMHIGSNNESDWKLAIMEADKIVDKILILKNYKGESMAERMTSMDKKDLESIELLWEAHKIRNRIAHQPGFKLDYSQAKRIISYYEEILKDLRAL